MFVLILARPDIIRDFTITGSSILLRIMFFLLSCHERALLCIHLCCLLRFLSFLKILYILPRHFALQFLQSFLAHLFPLCSSNFQSRISHYAIPLLVACNYLHNLISVVDVNSSANPPPLILIK